MSQGHSDRYSSFSENSRTRGGQKTANHTSYEKYKAALHAMFDGKTPMPEHLRAKDSEGESVATSSQATKKGSKTIRRSSAESKTAARSTRRLSGGSAAGFNIFLEAVKRSSTTDEITRTINSLLEAGYSIPDDEEILSKGLAHRDENIVLQILQKLKLMLSEKPAKSPRLLKIRLENAALMTSVHDVKSLCQTLRAQI